MIILNTEPLGNPTDPLLTFSLAEIQAEFPTEQPYFASDRVVCLADPIHPYWDAECSVLATQWVPSEWSAVVYVAPVATPEPRWDIGLLVLLVVAFLLLARRGKRQ